MTRFEEYKLLFYQKEVEKKIMIEELKEGFEMEEIIDKELKALKESLVEKDERIKRLVGENITLITENMKLAYEAKWLRKRVEFLEMDICLMGWWRVRGLYGGVYKEWGVCWEKLILILFK